MEESEDAPLLHAADLMHELLRAAADGPADIDDALTRLRADLRAPCVFRAFIASGAP